MPYIIFAGIASAFIGGVLEGLIGHKPKRY